MTSAGFDSTSIVRLRLFWIPVELVGSRAPLGAGGCPQIHRLQLSCRCSSRGSLQTFRFKELAFLGVVHRKPRPVKDCQRCVGTYANLDARGDIMGPQRRRRQLQSQSLIADRVARPRSAVPTPTDEGKDPLRNELSPRPPRAVKSGGFGCRFSEFGMTQTDIAVVHLRRSR